MRFLRRFAAVGAAVTVIDVGGLVVGAALLDWHLAVIDALAVTVATVVSYVAHRAISYAAEPARRWFRDLPHYLVAAALALVADVGVFSLLTTSGDRGVGAILGPKLLALGAAFLVRISFYRRAMFHSVRADQRTPRPRPAAPGAVRLSVVIPAYREAEGIAETLGRVEVALGHLRDDGGLEIVVVDDGSPDDTAGAARRGGADVVVEQRPNRGKGAAVRAGVLAASGRTVAFTDADLSYSPEQLLGLLARVEEGWDVVVGSRKHTDTRTLVTARRVREIGGRVINALTSVVLLGQYRDTQCGLKAFRSDAARLIFSRSRIEGFAFDVEVFHLVERFRLTLLEVPVEVVNSTRSTVRVVRDAGRLVRDLFRIRRTAHLGGYELAAGEAGVSELSPAGARPGSEEGSPERR